MLAALRRADGREVSHPATGDLVLEEGDRVLVLGDADAIARLRDNRGTVN